MPSSFIGQATGDPLPPEAASPLFPPAVSSAGLRKHLVGLGNLLDAQADFTGIDPQELAHTHIRAATYDIESELRMPFFVARFCSKTLADELGLIQGTDYDRITPPMSYRLRDWQVATGRLRLYWSPMAGNVEMLRLALTANVIGPDIPVEWINPDLETAEVHIIPTSAASTTFALSAINPLYSVGQRSGVVPCFVHVRYSAGLVRLPSDHSLWNPDHLPFDTQWDQNLIIAYQRAIAQLAAVYLMREALSYLDQGGLSLSLDGMSQSVNPVLEQRANGLESTVQRWVQATADRERPIAVVTV
jgi:hypothetical protein